jgi:hypothetical protein
MTDAQLFSDFLQKSIMTRERQVRNADLRGVLPPRRGAGRDDRNAPRTAFRYHKALARRTIDGIDDVIKLFSQDVARVGWEKERVDWPNLAIRVDGFYTRGQDIDFWLSELAFDGMKLAIDVADTNIVQIDQRETAEAGASERFDSPRADAAKTDHGHVGVTKPIQADGREQPAESVKPCLKIFHVSSLSSVTSAAPKTCPRRSVSLTVATDHYESRAFPS